MDSIILDDLINNPKKVLYLCGAGISFDWPTNIPTVNRFINSTLKECNATQQVIAAVNIASERITYRFESLIDEIRKIGDRNLSVTKIFDSNSYNIIHSFLGQMLLQGSSIITTNFDTCIENSIELNENNRIVFDGKDLQITQTKDNMLIKIHGSNPWKDEKNNELVITVKELAKTAKGFTLLPNWRDYVLSKIKDSIVIVLGYSCSDDFDITPILLASSPQKIIWIDYDRRYDLPLQSNEINSSKIQKIKDNKPLFYFRGKLNAQLEVWSKTSGINITNGEEANRYTIAQYVDEVFSSADKKQELINEILLSHNLYELVSKRAENESNEIILSQVVKAKYRLGMYNEVMSLLENSKVESICKQKQSEILYFKSSALYYLGNRSEALQIAKKHYILSRSERDFISEVHSLNHMGAIYFAMGKVRKARWNYRKALKLSSNITIEGEATASWGLGDIEFVRKKYTKALKLYEVSRQIYLNIGQNYGLAYINLNIGMAFTETKQYLMAEDCLKNALIGFTNPNNSAGLLYTYYAYIKLYHRSDLSLKSIPLFNDAMQIVSQFPTLPMAYEVVIAFLAVFKMSLKNDALAKTIYENNMYMLNKMSSDSMNDLSSLLKAVLFNSEKRKDIRKIKRQIL